MDKETLEEYEGLANDIEMTNRALSEAAKNIKSELDSWMGEDITEVTSGRRKVEQVVGGQQERKERKSFLTRLKNAFSEIMGG